MMFNIKQLNAREQKANICNTILRALLSWFGVESSAVDYVYETHSMPFGAAFDEEKPIGFIALKVHNSYTSEVRVMGVLKEYHRHGIGKRLIERCESLCSDNGTEYLRVKTLDESAESERYANTRNSDPAGDPFCLCAKD